MREPTLLCNQVASCWVPKTPSNALAQLFESKRPESRPRLLCEMHNHPTRRERIRSCRVRPVTGVQRHQSSDVPRKCRIISPFSSAMETPMSRPRTSRAEQSTYEWNQPQTFGVEVSWAGIRIACLNCRDGGRVVLSLAGSTPDGRPTFQFKCACGNEVKRTVFNAASGFPAL